MFQRINWEPKMAHFNLSGALTVGQMPKCFTQMKLDHFKIKYGSLKRVPFNLSGAPTLAQMTKSLKDNTGKQQFKCEKEYINKLDCFEE